MTYKLAFLLEAEKEWKALDTPVREQFRKKLKERLENPKIPSAKLSDMPNCYKIKLSSVGYRLVYRVDDGILIVTVIAVGRRDGMAAYKAALKRL
jgi:mRNA interferase RelE/StbE